ncbi:hypothetical protein CTheo_7953 [Ceratobasidium theobromae]|uniref:Uncharacterized protein n=1 Tax=Ceratobasidium theobromae TaxID=1582974 RepID=A0A5N5QA09_9AGAM|nr:hypothetical protein CTheo_7953 [Ceratobasidium theobromae]
MSGIFVRGGRPIRVHFDTSHLLAIAARQLGRNVERAGGVLVSHPSNSDVLVVDPAAPWVFHDFIKTKRPELRPSVVLAFWIPLCLVTRSLVWIGSSHWPNVSVPFERPPYPETPQGVLAYGSFLAGRTYSQIAPFPEPKRSPRVPHETEHDITLTSNIANSDREVSQALEPGSESEDEPVQHPRTREGISDRMGPDSSLLRQASPTTAFKPPDKSHDAEKVEVSNATPLDDTQIPSEDVEMLPSAPSPVPDPPPPAELDVALASRHSSLVDPALNQVSPALESSSTTHNEGSTPVPPQQTTASPQPGSPPTPAIVELVSFDLNLARSVSPISLANASQHAVDATTPTVSDTLAPTQEPATGGEPSVAEGVTSAVVKPLVVPPVASKATELPASEIKISTNTNINSPLTRSDANAPDAPFTSITSNIGHTSTTSVNQASAPASAPKLPSPKPAVQPPPSTSDVQPVSTLSVPKTPAASKSPSPVVPTGLKYRLESTPATLTPVTSSKGPAATDGSSEAPTTSASPSTIRIRPKPRPVPTPDGAESAATAEPSSSPSSSLQLRPSIAHVKSKLNIIESNGEAKVPKLRLGTATVKNHPSAGRVGQIVKRLEDTHRPVVVGSPDLGQGAVQSSQSTTSLSRPSTVSHSPASTGSSTVTATAITPTNLKKRPSLLGSTISAPKRLVIRSPTASTVAVPIRSAAQSPKKSPLRDKFSENSTDSAASATSTSVPPPPTPPTPTPEQLAAPKRPWTKEEDQYIIDYMNWVFAQDPLASTSEIMKEIAAKCPYRNVGSWQNRFKTKEDSIYMHGVPVLFERLTNRTSHGGRARGNPKTTLEILSGTRTRSRRTVDYAGSSSEEEGDDSEEEYGHSRKRARHEGTSSSQRRRSDRRFD